MSKYDRRRIHARFIYPYKVNLVFTFFELLHKKNTTARKMENALINEKFA